MKRKLIALVLSLSLVVSLSACGKDDNNEGMEIVNQENQEEQVHIGDSSVTEDTTEVVDEDSTGKITVADIKNKYGAIDDVGIKPFYNVEQTTEFMFHFNSEVEPALAVTVHTDPSCCDSSIVYQMNNAFTKEGEQGMYVLVKPGSPVLNSSDRADGKLENYNWGNAPVYYLSINYDMDSTDVKELEKPLVIPFTVKSTVSIPNLTCSISNDGVFTLNWQHVEGAVSYNIYEANEVREESPARELTRSQAGYVGDHLALLTSVSGDTTSFSDFHLDGTDNQLVYGGYVSVQNFYDLNTYYVTAVDENGNESLFSMAVEGWRYNSQLPSELSDYYVTPMNYFPDTVLVKMCDNSEKYFPVDYYLEESNDIEAIYSYRIQGTKLSGKVAYRNNDKNYEKEILSASKLGTLLYEVENNVNIIPDNQVDTITGTDNTYNLGEHVEKAGYTKLAYDENVLLTRADLESARIVNDGVYPEGKSFRDMLNVGRLTESDTNTESSSSLVESKSNEGESDVAVDEVEKADTEKDISVAENQGDTDVNSEEIGNTEEESNSESSVSSENLVEKQIEETNKQVEEGNTVEIQETKYAVFADSAEEEYLALNMIDVQEEISLQAFPSLQNAEHLLDVIYKVMYQNPYIFGMTSMRYDQNTMTLFLQYNEDAETIKNKQEQVYNEAKKITDSITADNAEDIVKQTYDYLEESASYDMSALEQAEQNDYKMTGVSPDAFTPYGVLCKKTGVCQSYALATKLLLQMKGVDCDVVTGYANSTIPHAWNIINYDGNWYWIDTTNNGKTSKIPYMLYQTSSNTATSMQYVLDDMFDTGTDWQRALNEDDSKDYYVENGMVATTRQEVIDKLAEQLESNTVACVRVGYEEEVDQKMVYDVIQGLMGDGAITESELDTIKVGGAHKYIVMIK